MNKNKRISVICTILAAIMVLSFCGCELQISFDKWPPITLIDSDKNTGDASSSELADNNESAKHLALVIGERQNSPKPDLSIVKDILKEAYIYGGSLDVYMIDGDPSKSNDHVDIDPVDQSLSPENKEKKAKENANKLMAALAKARAKSEESNVMEAVNLAAEKLQTYSSGEKIMKIFDSGISTKGEGLVEFTPELEGDIDRYIEHLKTVQAIKNYKDIDITWYCFGMTYGEQENITSLYRENLKTIWTKIFTEGGADVKDNTFNHDGSVERSAKEKSDYESYPKVSVISVVIETFKHTPYNPTEDTDIDEILNDNTVLELEIDFDPGVNKIINAEKTAEYLKPIAEAIKSRPEDDDIQLYVIGCTSSYSKEPSENKEEENKKFGQIRADAVCEVLIKYNKVPEKKIRAIGAGFSDKDLYQTDVDANGSFVEGDNAQKNRKVYVMYSNHPWAQKYKE